ncbi:MAG: hypothetical protein KME64_38490 [Scytonematopsis contorta HA4267-MV1]|jgi:hypothetical protein|nr:hypothetical protein [Scytonematopsis contorta HA4267-MV1]
MGLTISYKLSLNNAGVDEVREKITTLRNLATKIPFSQIDEQVELEGEACRLDEEDVHDPYIFLKIRALKQVESSMDCLSYKSAKYMICFDTLPGEGAETAAFGLASYEKVAAKNNWYWTGFCKTQYASNPEYGGLENFFKCHLIVVKMLDLAQKLGITCEVHDESGYWDNRNKKELAAVIRSHNIMMAAFTGKLKDDLQKSGIGSTAAAIFDFPDFEYLEAEGNKHS